ncbi:DUF1330 domain-containing protein [Streptomyces sp. NPDC052236]|uniref:DUF1330 domain-containing protein n=1 Tax=Streptomyces sp. NPDC052236 TaxID=3365686 RepID=UPI0037CED466
MAYYMMVALKKHDAEMFAKYQKLTAETLTNYEWTPLSINAPSKMIEGEADPDVCVLLTFPDEAKFDRWWNSTEYSEVKHLRHNSTNVLLAVGFDGQVLV